MSLNIPSSSDAYKEFLNHIKLIAENTLTQANQVRGNLDSFSGNQLKRYIDSLQSYRVQLPNLGELLGTHIQAPIPLQGDESREEIESRLSLELKIISAYSGALMRSEQPLQISIPKNAITNLMCIDYEIVTMHMRGIQNRVQNSINHLQNKSIDSL